MPKQLPPCASAMGCLCAGHASGLSARKPCDTREVKPGRAIENALPKGSYAVALIQKSNYNLISGITHYSRYWIVRVESADRDGRVKAYAAWAGAPPRKVDRYTTIYSLGAQHLPAAARLFAKQPLDFTGYADKEHLRLALVNVEARDTIVRESVA